MGNRLRLTNEEDALIKKRYPDIDMDDLMMPMEGMSTITNLDMLISSLNYDIENRKVDNRDLPLCINVKKKAEYFKAHKGKNYVPGFDSDKMAKKADEIAVKALGEPIGDDMYRIDQLINYVRSIKDEEGNEKELILLAMYLGSKLGELMLNDTVLNAGYDWDRTKKYKYPCLCNPQSDLLCNPISFVYSKLNCKSSAEDSFGTTGDFYYRFLDLIKARG